MRVLFIADSYNICSFNENALSYSLLSKALKDNNNQILSIIIYDKDDAYFDKSKSVLYLPKTKLNNLLFQISSFKLLIDTLNSFKPEVIHVLNESKLSSLLNFISDKYDIPIIKTICNEKEKNNENIAEYIVHSEHKKDLLRNELMTRYINVVPFGINIKDFDYDELDKFRITAKRKELKINGTSKTILTIGDDNTDVVIRGYYSFIISHPELDVMLLVINNNNSHPELIELTNELNINNRIIFLNKLSYQEIILFYKLSDVYLGNKLSNDNIVHYLYALNAMNIILTTYDANLFSLIKDNETGFYYKDEDSLAKELYHIFSLDDKKISEIKNNAKQTVITYSLDKYYKGMLKVYERAIKSKW